MGRRADEFGGSDSRANRFLPHLELIEAILRSADHQPVRGPYLDCLQDVISSDEVGSVCGRDPRAVVSGFVSVWAIPRSFSPPCVDCGSCIMREASRGWPMGLPNSFCDGAYCDFGDFEAGFRKRLSAYGEPLLQLSGPWPSQTAVTKSPTCTFRIARSCPYRKFISEHNGGGVCRELAAIGPCPWTAGLKSSMTRTASFSDKRQALIIISGLRFAC